MPELPEVETTLRGVSPFLLEKNVREVIVRRRDLRIPVPVDISQIHGLRVCAARRRAKYIILSLENNHHLIIHLGMSGSLRICEPSDDFRKHDHIALTMDDGRQMRFHDPRRFGIFDHCIMTDVNQHFLLEKLGPEPFDDLLDANYLREKFRQRKSAIKVMIMNNDILVGVGNIYASESLFRAGISPLRSADSIALSRLKKLLDCIREVLQNSITQGGTTLRDFLGATGEPGYFKQKLFVYDRANEPCRVCGKKIKHIVQAQRSTYYCPSCQR